MTHPIGRAAANSLSRKLVAEGVGTCLLLAAVVGSGIMGERLAGGNVAIALLANTIATGGGADCADSHLRSGIRRAFQPGRVVRRCLTGRVDLAGRRQVRRLAVRRGSRR